MYFDLQRVKNKKTKKQFLQKYGHLRPNTFLLSFLITGKDLVNISQT